MPLLRTLTMKIKTKLTPPASPTSASPTSFEVVGRERNDKRPEPQRVRTGSSVESFACVDARGLDARVMVEALEKAKLVRGERRRSKFKEEF